ncbi:O-antigen translocase [Pseudomonas mosselii]|uniref:O-antigen translocase n=1 Tax=Pseudomonas mosselii TaxID=78327 RepID=UPI001F3274C6|nr:O-antigen translocase [Pseudomonas mosselii]MDH0629782.1 O-antigen translocase [Pseudomonas mosselii]MDH0678886.1 O-antigen translocase [Pseudomonas mosselii]MDH0927668.1 O-antigen translocase [Pseudomonas mosselii]MDH1135751.1 O-antigen translocase [Pseudomonas mosselii]MDH1140232.1 O-antigen translocase [Pseudomonas mosselii]
MSNSASRHGVESVRKRIGVLAGALFTTAAHLSKILVGFLFLKLVAVYLGVEGLGALGNLMSAVLFLSLLAGGGIQNGVIKYVAEYRHKPKQMLRFLAGARLYSLGLCTLILVGAMVFSGPLSHYLLGGEYAWLMVVLGVAQFGFAFTNIVNGTANGLHETRVYATIQIVGNLLTLPLAWLLIRQFGLVGAALSIIVFYLSYSLPALYFFASSKLRRHVRWRVAYRPQFRKLSGFTLMAAVGAVSVPLVEIVVRNLLLENAGLQAAGLWQASLKLSSAYMGFFVVFLAAYFIPIVSSLQDRRKVAAVVRKFMVLAICLFGVGAIGFYGLRSFFIPLLLSADFAELGDFIQYQLLGDLFRVTSYVIGFVVVAKAATRIYVLGEISQGVLFCLFSTLGLKLGWGLQGVFIAHLAMNVIYFACSVIGFYIYTKRVV